MHSHRDRERHIVDTQYCYNTSRKVFLNRRCAVKVRTAEGEAKREEMLAA